MARSAAGPNEQILDAPLQDVVGLEANRVPHSSPFQCLIEGRQGERRVGADDNRLPSRAVPINDGKQDLVPLVRTVDVAGSELGREAVALWAEDEERVIADGLEMAIVGGTLLRPVHRTLRAIDIDGHALGRPSHPLVLHQFRIEANESLVVSLLSEDLRLKPVERRGERDARFPPLARGQHPKRRVLGQSLGVVGVLVTR